MGPPPIYAIRKALEWLLKRIWLFVAIIALAFGMAQTARLNGLQVDLPLIGKIGPEGWKPRAERLQRALDGVVVAQDAARQLAEEQKAREEQELREEAQETDNAIEEGLREELARARAYAARFRVRLENNSGGSCPTIAAATDQGPGNDEGASGAPKLDDPALVLVPERDVMICTKNTVLAEQWREWGLRLEARGQD